MIRIWLEHQYILKIYMVWSEEIRYDPMCDLMRIWWYLPNAEHVESHRETCQISSISSISSMPPGSLGLVEALLALRVVHGGVGKVWQTETRRKFDTPGTHTGDMLMIFLSLRCLRCPTVCLISQNSVRLCRHWRQYPPRLFGESV